MDESLLWTKVAALGQVAGAVATFAAVCVSLWLAHSTRRAHVKVQAGLRLRVAGDGSPFENVISIRVTNYGLRPARISSVGWQTGWLKWGPKWLTFRHAMQQFGLSIPEIRNPGLPYDLGPGQEVAFYISPDSFKEGDKIRDTFFCRHLPWKQNPSPTKTCAAVFVVASKAVVTRVERSLEIFLATGVIANGADELNAAADAKSESTA